MYEFQIFFQRNRKTLTRIGALLLLGLAGMLAVLPRADAHGTIAAARDPLVVLMSPQRVSSTHFATLTAPTHP